MNGRNRHNRSGQVMVLTLLGITLLGSLVFYVVNVGDQVNRKVVMQNSADAAVISGAAWFARSANVVGMNNVAQTRMLALVPILDSFPLSTKMASEEVAAFPGGWTYLISARAGDEAGCQSVDGELLEPFASSFAVPLP